MKLFATCLQSLLRDCPGGNVKACYEYLRHLCGTLDKLHLFIPVDGYREVSKVDFSPLRKACCVDIPRNVREIKWNCVFIHQDFWPLGLYHRETCTPSPSLRLSFPKNMALSNHLKQLS